MSTSEVRCPSCGKLNRLRTYSFRQIPHCGNCKDELPERPAPKTVRLLYRIRYVLAFIATLVAIEIWQPPFLVALITPNRQAAAPSQPVVAACSDRPQPRQGLYTRPSNAPRVAPFNIQTREGANYLVKLKDFATGSEVISFFLYGGTSLETRVPAGRFILKYVSGEVWCGSGQYFGKRTAAAKADEVFFFGDGKGYTVTLFSVRNGNLKMPSIDLSDF